MGKRVHYVRTVTETEEQQLRTLANSRTEPHQCVQRAQLVVSMIDDSQLTSSQSRSAGWIQKWGFRRAMDSAIQ